MRAILKVAAIVGVACVPLAGARAWDAAGHRIVAGVAQHYLLPETRDKVQALLASDHDAGAPRDLAGAAVWADSQGDRTKDWHFAHIRAGRPNIPAACYGQPALPQGTPASKGPEKACVIDKINQFARELGDAKVSGEERLLALKYLTSLVADIHQPLRMADEGNNHGLGLGVTARGMTAGDLFTFWDSIVVTRLSEGASPEAVAATLVYRLSPALEHQWATRTPQLWALETYQLGVDRAYGMVRAYDDDGRAALQDAEIAQAVDTTALQLSRAGVRLAFILNQALAPSALPPAPAPAIPAGNATAGKDFATKVCAACHVLTPTSVVDTMAPDFAAIANTDGMTAAALHDFLFGPHPTMPNLHLTQKQASDLTAYILSLRKAR